MVKVSIIVPNYNHAKFLFQRLDSIFNQTFQDFEVILLDDCSTDNSINILKKYTTNPKVTQFLISERNSGNTFKQWEKGIELAKCDLIWIAESDDWAEITFLEECIKYYEVNKDKNIGIINCNSNVIIESGTNVSTKDWIKANNEIFKSDSFVSGKIICQNYLIEHNIIPNASATLIKRSALETIDLDSDFKLCGDWYIWFEILLNHDLLYIDKTLNNFRKHSSNITHSNDLQLQAEGIKLLRLMSDKLSEHQLSLKLFYGAYFRWCFYGSFWGDSFSIGLKALKNYFYKFDLQLVRQFIQFFFRMFKSKIRALK